MFLYHTGFQEIRQPDVFHGRRNADFGQGFYLTANSEFARRWAKERRDEAVILNRYAFNTEGLRVHQFARSREWFEYIFANRSGRQDSIDADVVIGPIANDTIYDTFGIITSGFLAPEEAMQLLMIGPAYEQIALKTLAAARQLTWLDAETIETAELKKLRAMVASEEAEYQKNVAEQVSRFSDEN